MLLSIDTSSNIVSVALLDLKNQILLSRSFEYAKGLPSSEKVLCLVNDLISSKTWRDHYTSSKEKEISFDDLQFSKIVVASGPGSYTGLRGGLSIAYGFSISKKIKLKLYSNFLSLNSLFFEEIFLPKLSLTIFSNLNYFENDEKVVIGSDNKNQIDLEKYRNFNLSIAANKSENYISSFSLSSEANCFLLDQSNTFTIESALSEVNSMGVDIDGKLNIASRLALLEAFLENNLVKITAKNNNFIQNFNPLGSINNNIELIYGKGVNALTLEQRGKGFLSSQ